MTEREILKIIYPSVVTWDTDWRQSVQEVRDLNLEEISLFLTGVKFDERQEVYAALKKTAVKKIPHVHLRNDMKEAEIEYVVKNFNSAAFTLHYALIDDFVDSKYRQNIFIKNNTEGHGIKNYDRLKNFGGLCIDLSHLVYSEKIEPENYARTIQEVDNYRVGCNHISDQISDKMNIHYVHNLSDLDYLKNIPKKCFSQYLCFEVGNPIKEQLEFKKYVAKILATVWQ